MRPECCRAHTNFSVACWLLGILYAFPALASEAPIQDPTRPVDFNESGIPQKQEQNLRLQAIFLTQGRAEAVINGRRLRPGDMVDQARIIAIGPGRVMYERDGTRAELILRPTVTRPVGGGE
jgi:hypothetical protein